MYVSHPAGYCYYISQLSRLIIVLLVLLDKLIEVVIEDLHPQLLQ